MTWDAYNRRKKTLREMLAVADRQRDITLTDLIDSVEGGREAFPTDTELLFELQMTWFQRLSGQMDRLLSEDVSSLDLVPVTAWVNAAADLPGARALLDAHRDTPELRKAFAKELAYLATSAGVPASDSDITIHGQRIQESARSNVAAVEPRTETDAQSRVGIMARLRSVMAA